MTLHYVLKYANYSRLNISQKICGNLYIQWI